MDLSLYEIARIVDAKNDIRTYADSTVNKIEFDSRLIGEGDLFLPLRGSRDGHDFIETAIKNGAVATFSEKPLEVPHILVADCLEAFQKLAAAYLEKTGVAVIAVTGSNGKTTTKDMLAHILSTTYQVYKTQGNYNNDIGLPYTVLHMPEGTEKLVLEMGQDHLGDIHRLSLLVRPAVGIVTMIGEAHLAFFKNTSEIAKGKMQLADGMPDGGLLVVPDDPLISDYIPENQEIIFVGKDIYLIDLHEAKDSLTFTASFMEDAVSLPVTGAYNATNALIAAYVAKRLGVTEEAIITSLANLTLTANRTQWYRTNNGVDILSDVYNANPTAMRLVLETFSAIPREKGGRKVALLADMKELGETSVARHSQMITSLSPDTLDEVICYGEDIAELAQLASQVFPVGYVYFFAKNETVDQMPEMLAHLKETLGANDQLLLKGSHSMGLARILEQWDM